MRKIRAVVVMPLLIAALALASCGHASVAGNSCPLLCQAPPQPSASTAPSVAGSWQQQFRDFKTGITGAVGAPAPASFGGSPVPAQIAASDHPEFETDAINGAFPALASSLQATSSGLSAASSIQSATATLTSTMPTRGNLPDTVIQLSVPSIGLNAQWDVSDILSVGDDFGTFGSNYVVLGSWESRAAPAASGASGDLQNVTWFSFGYETPATAMPTAGQAAFTGFLSGNVFAPTGGQIAEAQLGGNAIFSVDFSSGKMTGAFTNITTNAAPYSWNDVSVAASIAAGTNKFNGSTAVTSAPPGPFSLNASASGSINGAFYGPAAQNLGAIWTLSDGTTSAIGGVVARH